MAPRSRPARIDEILEGAMRAFARGGYTGTSTTEVAKEVGVSQPYIVTTFGNKETLFIEAHRHAGDKILAAFEAVEGDTFVPSALGEAYRLLVTEQPDALRMYNHGFAAAQHGAIGVEVRRLFVAIYCVLRDLGAGPVAIRDFMGRGFVINTVLSMDLPVHAEELGMTEFLGAVFDAGPLAD